MTASDSKAICRAARGPLTMTVEDVEKKFCCTCCDRLGEARIEIGPKSGLGRG